MRVLCTAGHVDHGKSSLVRALTGTDPDRLVEEQRRGLTIELGFAWTQLDGVGDVVFVDLPGHERFVPTMLAGAGPVQTALFVVAADEGWMPQSAEHLAILDLLDVTSGVIALTRADLVDEETLAISAELIAEELADSGLGDAPVIAVSSLDGRGLPDLREALGDVLRTTPSPEDLGRPRLWVDRAFTIRGAGTRLTGTLAGGALAVGDQLTIEPGGHEVRVRGLQSLQRAVPRAEPGWRVAVNLVGADVEQVPRGSTLVADDQWVRTAALDALATPIDLPLSRRGAWRAHVGTAEVGASLYPVEGRDLSRPGPMRIELDQALPLAAGDRLVLRDVGRGRTAGGAVVLDPQPQRRPKGRIEREVAVASLETIASATTPPDRLHALVGARGDLPTADALAMAGATPGHIMQRDLVPVGANLLSAERWSVLSSLVIQAVGDVHQRRPALAVVDRNDARRLAATTGASAAVIDAVIDEVVARGRLEAAPGGLRVPGHQARLTVAQQIARTALLARLDAEGWEPGDLDAAAEATEADEDLLAALVREGELVPLANPAGAVTRRTIEQAVSVLAGLRQPFTASEARVALGTSRKHALPLLEALDAAGRTRRDGDVRHLRT